MPAKRTLYKVVRVELNLSPEQVSKLDAIVLLDNCDRNKMIRKLIESGWAQCVRCGLIKPEQAKANEPAKQTA